MSLNYHASGFQPDQHPGWVGLGWNLNVGGRINRTIRDLPDEYDDPTTGGYALQRGYYFTHNYLDVSDWDSNTRIRALCSEQDRGIPKYLGDSEPDEFSFNFMGYSGKFYLDHKGAWQVQSDKPLKVTLLNPSAPFVSVPISRPGASLNGPYPKAYGGFSVITEDGTQYIFGGTASSVEYSIPFYDQQVAPWFADSWVLTRIIAPDGHEVTFSYARETTFINQMYVAFDQATSNNRANDGTFLGTFSCSNFGSPLGTVPEAYYRGKLLSPVYLTNIQGSNTNVTFSRGNTTELTYSIPVYDYYYNHIWTKQYNFLPYLEDYFTGPTYRGNPAAVLQKLQWKQLNQLTVNQQNALQKSFVFSYSSNDLERLTLQKIQEFGSTGSSKPAFKFTYYDYSYTYNGTVLNRQAQYLSSRTDHWGFFNDVYAPFDNRTSYYSFREPSATPAVYLSGMLKQITYPTGGTTEFLYEPHSYSKQVALNRQAPANPSTNKQAGGVRIKKITSFSLSDPTNKLEKEYFYVSGYTAAASSTAVNGLTSTGVLGGQVQYEFLYTLKSFTDNSTVTNNVFSSQSVLPSSMNSHGSHVGYSQVVEKRSDNSYTKYSFSNFDTEAGHPDEQGNVLQPTRTAYEPFSMCEQERGNLTKEEMYSAADKCVKRRQTDYIAFQKGTAGSFVRAVKVRLTGICGGSQQSLEEGTAYRLYTYASLPSQQSETVYDSNGESPHTTTTSYTYDSSKLIASSTTTDSKGKSLVVSYTYPFNIVYPNASSSPPTDAEASAIYAMASQNMLNYPIETITTRNGQISAAQVQTYKWGGAGNAYILPYKSYNLESGQLLTNSQYTHVAYSAGSSGPFVVGGSNAQMRLKTTWMQYDSQSNPIGLLKDGGLTSSYLWDYNKTLLVAKVDNAAPNQIAYTGFEADGPSYSISGTFQSAGPYGWDYNPKLGQLDASGNPINLQRSGGATGKGFYILAGNWSVNRANLAPGDYELSFWAQAGLGSVSVWTDNASQIISQTDERTDPLGFHLLRYRIRVTQGSIVNPTGSVAFDAPGQRIAVDDVRLYPVGALMTTYTHAPGIGLTSTSDANSRSIHYEYDELNRLSLLRDHDRNVLKQYQYYYRTR